MQRSGGTDEPSSLINHLICRFTTAVHLPGSCGALLCINLYVQPGTRDHCHILNICGSEGSDPSVQASEATDTLAETKGHEAEGLNMSHDGDSMKRRSPRRTSAQAVT
jgi:hypothetical protein